MAAKFAARNKAHYIQAVESGKGKDWTVVMGNEAGGIEWIPLTSEQNLLKFH
jgi:hypothetical protein